jgi:hypothetical protein
MPVLKSGGADAGYPLLLHVIPATRSGNPVPCHSEQSEESRFQNSMPFLLALFSLQLEEFFF